jgi:hypothetical protein
MLSVAVNLGMHGKRASAAYPTAGTSLMGMHRTVRAHDTRMPGTSSVG